MTVSKKVVENAKCDLLLFVATSTPNLQQLHVVASHFSLPFPEKRKSTLGTYYDLGVVGKTNVIVVKTGIGLLGGIGMGRPKPPLQATHGGDGHRMPRHGLCVAPNKQEAAMSWYR